MSSIVNKTISDIKSAVLSAAEKSMENGTFEKQELPTFIVEEPADSAHGDFAANAAMVWARALKCAPRKIAEEILNNIDFEGTFIDRCEIAGPGFLNFYLKQAYYAAVVEDVLTNKENYGSSDVGKGKKVMVEFVSANPTGPMHIGNARGGALGDTLASVLEKAGYDVTREFYVNDAGNQIQKFGLSLEARYLQQFDDTVPFPEDGYHGADITERALEFIKIHGDRYVNAPSEERRKALVDYALPLNIAALKEDLSEYRINYDVWFRESSLYADGTLDKVIQMMKDKGLTYEREGALWYKNAELRRHFSKSRARVTRILKSLN